MKITINITKDKTTVEIDNDEPITMAYNPTTRELLGKPIGDLLVTEHDTETLDDEPKPKPDPVLLRSDPDEAPNLPLTVGQAARHGKLAKPAKATNTRNCEICGNSLAGYHALAKVCSDECKKVKQARYAKESYEKRNPGAGSRNGRETGDPVLWCKHCMAYTTHSTAQHNTLQASEGLNLAANAPEVKPELRSVCCEALVEEAGDGDSYRCKGCGHLCVATEHKPPFTDKWDCGACREAQRPCRLHADMEADGRKAPTYRHQGAPA